MPIARWTFRDSAYQHYLRWAGVPVEYDIRSYLHVVEAVEAFGAAKLTDDELAARARGFHDEAREPASSEAALSTPDAHQVAAVFAVAREAAARLLQMRPFDVQLAAAVALHDGRLAQLATGEGKTLVAVLPAILNALSGRGVHIFTANDYLARRDAEWMGPVYRFFGLDARFVAQGMTHDERRRAYAADITYVTAKEAGFDFLRDHTADSPASVVGRPCHYAIVDEADFILIDEARVPLVIAGPAPHLGIEHARLAALVRALQPGLDYDADQYRRTVVLTERGFREAGKRLGGVDLHRPRHRQLLSAVHVALHAHALLQRDRDYIVRDGRIDLVDEFTGRVADNRRWPHGIQPAVEAKEGVEVRPEGTILGSIPIQHFVRLYPRIAGMTATAVPAAEEFKAFFGLTTVVFPPNRSCTRVDEQDVVFSHRAAKTHALLDEIAAQSAVGRPVLVGTASVGESEDLAASLQARGMTCHVLNARHDDLEAQIVTRAGMPNTVTISTNMAGRGTDIVLGSGDVAVRERVVALGGLYVIGTNRHESRRIDDQLRGRAGRQGDPGASRFFISLDDDLIRRYGVMTLIPPDHRPTPGERVVEDPVVRREIARAQRIIEGQNFEIRKTLWRYSMMVDEQRHLVYVHRQALLLGEAEVELCRTAAAKQWAALVAQAGEPAVVRTEQLLMMHLLDRAWAEHLALIEDIREGIHLQRLGGREPLTEFQRQIIDAFANMMERVESQTVDLFRQLTVEGGRLDLARVGVGGSSSTWTYLVNDNPFSTLSTSLLASRTLTATAGMLAVFYWPVTLVASARALWGRRKRRRVRRGGLDNDET